MGYPAPVKVAVSNTEYFMNLISIQFNGQFFGNLLFERQNFTYKFLIPCQRLNLAYYHESIVLNAEKLFETNDAALQKQ